MSQGPYHAQKRAFHKGHVMPRGHHFLSLLPIFWLRHFFFTLFLGSLSLSGVAIAVPFKSVASHSCFGPLFLSDCSPQVRSHLCEGPCSSG